MGIFTSRLPKPSAQPVQGIPAEEQALIPILLSGSGRTGSTALMSLLGTDRRVAFDREYPFESRYLTYILKFALLTQYPDFFPFIEGEKLFDFNYLGVGGPVPDVRYLPSSRPEAYLSRKPLQNWASQMWRVFSSGVVEGNPTAKFYAEKAPVWFAPLARTFLNCYTVYNVRDPRDIFLSANAFMRKRSQIGFGRRKGDTDLDYARALALAFVNTFEQYYADRIRTDIVLIRYEDFVNESERIRAQLQELMGLELSDFDNQHFEFHRTADDLPSTLNRWEREALPTAVLEFFESYLREEIQQLGYRLTSTGLNGSPRFVSFAKNQIKLSDLSCSGDGAMIQEQDGAVVKIRGVDFWVVLPLEPFSAQEVREIWISIRGDIGDVFSLYWRSEFTNFSENKVWHLRYCPWIGACVLSFPVHEHPEWKGTIYKLRLDLFNSVKAPHKGKGFIRWVRLVT